MGVHIVNKVLSGILAIFSVLLLLTCTWTLTSLFIRNARINQDNCDENSRSRNGSFCKKYYDAEVINNEEKSDSREYWAKFRPMNYNFRLIVIICVFVVIAASLLQLLCSFALICSTSFKVAPRSRKVVGILFAVFILFLLSFSVPLAVNRDMDANDDNQLHTMTSLNTLFQEFINNLSWSTLLHDLNLFYLELFFNLLYLFMYMVTTCCLLRCSGNEQYYDI